MLLTNCWITTAILTAYVAFPGAALAEVTFPPAVQLYRVMNRNDGAMFVAGRKDGVGYLAEIPDPSGPPVEHALELPESQSSYLTTIAFDAEGSTYVAGSAVSGGKRFGFMQKYDRQRARVYSVRIGGEADATVRSLAVNAQGEALVNGDLFGDGFLTTPGAPPAPPGSTGYVVKLDARGKVAVAVRGVGVGAAAYDAAGNIYAAGVFAGLPASNGAFQREHGFQTCAGTGSFGFPCTNYQHVAKLSPDGTRILYSTFVAGSYGADTAGLSVTSRGEAILAGTTVSPDYPATPGSLIPKYIASAARKQGIWGPHPSGFPPPKSGFVTKLNADGSGLVWSTYFSGTGADSIHQMRILPDGSIAIAGNTGSGDLPGMKDIPRGCGPIVERELPFVSVLSGDGAALQSTVIPWEFAGRGLGIAPGPNGSIGAISSRHYMQLDLRAGSGQRAACLLDTADWTLLREIAPGQLITIFASGLEAAAVEVNGQPARVVYTSKDQINLQAPPELIPGQDAVIRIVTPDGVIEQRLPAVERSPSVLLVFTPFNTANPGVECGQIIATGYQPVALNGDGTRNECSRGAGAGGVVHLFLNGVGAKTPVVTKASDPDVDPIESVEFDPDSLLWKLTVRLTSNYQLSGIVPLVDGVRTRFPGYIIWR